MRKKQRYLIISLPQSSGGCLRIPSSLRWKLMMGRWMKPPQSRKRWLMTCPANKRFTMDPDRIHPRVMRELEKDLAKPLCNIYQQSWLTGEIPDGWNLAKVTPIYKNIWKDDPGKYRPYHGSRQDMEEIILSATAHAEQPGHQAQPKWKAGPAWPVRHPCVTGWSISVGACGLSRFQ